MCELLLLQLLQGSDFSQTVFTTQICTSQANAVLTLLCCPLTG